MPASHTQTSPSTTYKMTTQSVKQLVIFFLAVKGHLALHTNILTFAPQTYACHLAIYTNDFTFSSNLICRALINNFHDEFTTTIILIPRSLGGRQTGKPVSDKGRFLSQPKKTSFGMTGNWVAHPFVSAKGGFPLETTPWDCDSRTLCSFAMTSDWDRYRDNVVFVQ